MSENKILDRVNSPLDLKTLTLEEMNQLAEEIRQLLIEVVSKNGGHLAPNLGVVELTLALHRVFDSPKDKLIFDVGHQAYIHKIITGRREVFPTLRTYKGLSGFPKRQESEHDAFGVSSIISPIFPRHSSCISGKKSKTSFISDTKKAPCLIN